MARLRGKSAVPGGSGQPTPEQPVPEKHTPEKGAPEFSAGVPASPVLWITGLFAAATIVYLLVFFAGRPFRLPIWAYVMVPDDLAALWLGGDPSRFGLLDRVPIFLAAGFIHAWAVLAGWVVLRLLKFHRGLSRLEAYLFSAGVGLNVLASLCLFVGLAGQLRNRPVFAALAGLTVVLAAWLRPRASEFGESIAWGRAARWMWLGLPFVISILLGSALPPWYFDVREYHLQVPKEWFLQGRVDFVPHNVYGNMPLGAEMPAVLGMLMFPGPEAWWWGSLVGKVVLGGYAPLSALALYAAGRRFFSPAAGGLAALIFISLPWTAHVSMAGLIEGALAFYFLLAVYATWLMAPTGDPRDPGNPASATVFSPAPLACLAVVGFMAGAAAACKYPAVLFAVLPLAGWAGLRRFPAWDFRGVGALILAAAVAAGPWYAKNWVLAGNPTYPLLYQVFGGKSWTPAKDRQWTTAHQVPRDSQGHRYGAAALLDGIFMVGWKSDWLSPLSWPPALLGMALLRRRKQVLWCLGCTVYLFVTWWLATHRIDRFFVPAMVFVSLVGGAGGTWTGQRLWRVTFGIYLALGLTYNFLIVNSRFLGDTRYFVALADLRVDEPHASDPDYYHTHITHRYLNREARDGSRVMLVGDAQPFDLRMPVLYNTCFDDCVFEKVMRGKSREERLAALRELRVSHVLVFWHELDRYRSPGNYGYSDYVIRELVRKELVEEQGLLRRVELELDPENAELFEVLGWETGNSSAPSDPRSTGGKPIPRSTNHVGLNRILPSR